MKDKHLWKFRKISGNDLEIVLNSAQRKFLVGKF